MSTKHHILPNEIKRLQQEVVKRVTDSVGGPVGLYEEWPDEEPALIVTEDTGKHGRAFCRAIWENSDQKKSCLLDHQYRAQTLSQEPISPRISECRLGIHNAFCSLKKNSSTITLLGGAFHVSELKDESRVKLDDYVQSLPQEEQERLLGLWNDIPEYSQDYVSGIISKDLEMAASLYLFMVTELSRFRYEQNQVSHDLLIFLQSLIGNIETLGIEMKRSQNIGKRWDSRFEEVLKQCETYSEILGTRLGNLGEPEFHYYPLQKVVYDSVELQRSKAKKKWIDIHVNLEKTLDNKGQTHFTEIQMARDYLSRAFHNILDNAIKYSYSGGAEHPREVLIAGKFHSVKNVLGYEITVRNSGIGIEEDELEKVFDIGYQGRLRAGEMRPGFGVGLPFVKECIELHDGTISIESQRLVDGTWPTTVYIWLPLYNSKKTEQK